ncbi:hypothetical protein [Zavarzinia compransoris]|uniref:Uncharacterized protein n=1 Tax=Zavarzinia compransoris TaxID=1264899 RepID=A0A317EA57_9PROT|nr:hypothetical protein [Zavarzinia compransoris]PWR23998.1 hypothetical protein DKG75_05505 [Zavarzinia compransoris]TDP48258.1 hypothetical protein DES42_102561 [Zavarzinia compransoris]
MKINAILGSAVFAAAVAGATFVGAQDSGPVSEVSGQLSIFGGGDENGGLFGGAPSLTVPVDGSFAVQFDGIAGFVADEAGFAGGAVQLFYRDPQAYTVGIAGGGYYVDSYSQYAVSGIAEYYIDNLTLEGAVGFTTGQILEDQVYGRVGLAVYPNPNLRLGGGVTYSDTVGLGGDVQVEALLTDVPGLALFAAGAFDDKGATGYGGIRLYFTGRTVLSVADSAAESTPSLQELHRNYGRPNFFLSDPSGFGIRQISKAGGAINGGEPFGDIGEDGNNDPGDDTPPNSQNCQTPDLISTVQCTLGGLTNNTVLDPVTDLVDQLLNPTDGALSALTGPLADLTALGQGALAPLSEVVQALVGTQNSALNPLIDGLNAVIQGIGLGSTPTDIANQLGAIPGLGALLP